MECVSMITFTLETQVLKTQISLSLPHTYKIVRLPCTDSALHKSCCYKFYCIIPI